MASFQSARVGGGGITIDVDLGTDKLMAGAAKLGATIKQIEAGIKLKPEVDWQETAVLRGLRSIKRKVEAEVVKVRVQFEAQNAGILSAGARAGGGQGFGLSNFDSMVGLTSPARFGSNAAIIAGRSNAVPTVGDLNPSRASLAAATAQHRSRVALEARLAAEDHEPSILDELREARRGRTRAPSRAAGVGLLVGALTGVAFAEAVSTMTAGARYSNASFMANSTNKMASFAGQAGQVEALQSVRLLGGVAKLFDEASGFTRAMRVNAEAHLGERGAAVDAAKLTFNKVTGIEAEGRERLNSLRDKFAAEGVIISDDGKSVSAIGSAMGPASQAALRTYQAEAANVAKVNARAMLESTTDNSVRSASIRATNLRIGLKPFAASLTEFDAETDSLVALADPAKVEQVKKLREAKREELKATEGRRRGFAAFDAATNIAASETRVRNFGQQYLDEDALVLQRNYQRKIDMASNEGGDKREMKLEALAGARAFKAGLMVRGGGEAAVTYNPMRELIGDPLNLEPQLQARNRARTSIDGFINALGGNKAGDLGDRSVDDRDTSLLGVVKQIYEFIKDSTYRDRSGSVLLP